MSKQHLVWFLTVFVSLLTWTNQSAWASQCDLAKDPVQFYFEELPFNVLMDHRKNNQEIERFAREIAKEYVIKVEANLKQRMRANEVMQVEGLAHGIIDLQLNLTFKNRNMPDNSYCVYINNAHLKVGFKKMTVYISRQINENSCRYTVVKNHEFEHVKRHADGLARAIPSLKKIETLISNIPTRHGSDKQKVHKEMQDEILVKLQEIFSKLESDINLENAKLDTFENYRREAKLCIANAIASKSVTTQFPQRVDP